MRPTQANNDQGVKAKCQCTIELFIHQMYKNKFVTKICNNTSDNFESLCGTTNLILKFPKKRKKNITANEKYLIIKYYA